MKQFDLPTINKYVICALILVVMLLITDVTGSNAVSSSGTIIEKSYRPERIHLTKIRKMDENNQFVSFLTAETEPAERVVFVKAQSGKIIRMDCTFETFYTMDIGESIPYSMMQGFITNWSYFGIGIFKPVTTEKAPVNTSELVSRN